MQYESMMFCEHANECPTSICQCPVNCGCRERMCVPVSTSTVIKSATPAGGVIQNFAGTTGHVWADSQPLATFGPCRFWGELDVKPGENPQPGFEALHVERLHLTESTVRAIVAGHLPIKLFNGVKVFLNFAEPVMLSLSMVWGDVELFETGAPVLRNFVAVPEKFEGMPPPALVARVIKLLKASRNPL